MVETLLVHSARNVPCSRSYVRVGSSKEKTARTKSSGGSDPMWREEIPLTPAQASGTSIGIVLVRAGSCLPDSAVGFAIVSLRELRAGARVSVLICDSTTKGDAVLGKNKPCYVDVSLVGGTQAPAKPPSEKPSRHVFFLSRGTRGDMQPFITLAIGMAEILGWRVTICCESRYHEWVHQKTCAVKRGQVVAVASGGDTARRMNMYIAREFLFPSKTELAQWLMMGNSECDFYGSIPVFIDHLERFKAAGTPVDLLVSGFTTTGSCMLLSEIFDVPMIPLVLQPNAIPASHLAIEPINYGIFPKILERACCTHTAVRMMKNMTELPLTIMIRKSHGLNMARTWPTLKAQDVPIVLPISTCAYTKPSEWQNRRIYQTPFLLLRTTHDIDTSVERLSTECTTFLLSNREAGRKIILMTFSSMPVRTKDALQIALKMIHGSKYPLSVVFVGHRYKSVPASLDAKCDASKADGRLLELAAVDFGQMFQHIDAFVVHGGLGTTAEAMRCGKPVAITGVLHLDQRVWGKMVHREGCGPMPCHIGRFKSRCVAFADGALKEDSEWAKKAIIWMNRALDFDDGVEDGEVEATDATAQLATPSLAAAGVAANVEVFRKLLEEDGVKPVRVPPGKKKNSARVGPFEDVGQARAEMLESQSYDERGKWSYDDSTSPGGSAGVSA